MKGKCKYCGVKLGEILNIRCDNCDFAWRDGVKYGEGIIRMKFRETFRALKNFIGI